MTFWNFGAQGLVSTGRLISPAVWESFLTQISGAMLPLIWALAGEQIQLSMWGGCGLALFSQERLQ
jgi:hypothetical protein